MAARAIWAGTLKIGSSSLPVKLYPAVQDKSVHFHILDAKNKSRVKQHMVNPCTGEEVAKERRVANPGWLRFAPGGTAAVIMVWDIGTYELMEGNYYKGYLHFYLSGRKLKGEWQLIRSNREGDRQMWFFGKVRPSMRLVSKQRDDESALTRRTIEQIRTADDAVWNSKRSPAA